MRNNTNISTLPEPRTRIVIDHLYPFDIADYDLTNDKDFRKYFFDIERICRNSFSYKRFISFLRDHLDMNSCTFFKNINNIDTYSIKIHLHHTPLTLFDLVTTVFKKRNAMKQPLNVNLVAKEVMYNHYRMMIGLIPLSETVHELVHNGYLFIPTNIVFGNYKKFVEVYGEYLDPQTKETLITAEQYTETYDYMKETKILKMNMVYIDPSGSYDFPSFKDLATALQTHINEFDHKISEIQISNGKVGENNDIQT